uniref:Uncharacterized protein n=1 Tax=Meloidogyne enterolobii TaxID=390850 RepID=A0A6V7UZ50_MELEN|nr:unnamed protein product [Meloidogyne enterolobii]
MHLFLYFTLFFISASTSFDEPPVFFLVGSWLILVIIVLVAFGFVITPLGSFIEPTYCSETPLEHSPSLSCPFDWITVSVLFSVGVVHSIVLGVIVYFVVRFNRYLRRHVPLTTIPFTAARRLRTVGTRAPMEEVSLEWANN